MPFWGRVSHFTTYGVSYFATPFFCVWVTVPVTPFFVVGCYLLFKC